MVLTLEVGKEEICSYLGRCTPQESSVTCSTATPFSSIPAIPIFKLLVGAARLSTDLLSTSLQAGYDGDGSWVISDASETSESTREAAWRVACARASGVHTLTLKRTRRHLMSASATATVGRDRTFPPAVTAAIADREGCFLRINVVQK